MVKTKLVLLGYYNASSSVLVSKRNIRANCINESVFCWGHSKNEQ